jgi:hypothetical protein
MKDHLRNHQALDKLKRTEKPLTYGGQKNDEDTNDPEQQYHKQ